MKIYKLMKTELFNSGFFNEIKVTDMERWTAILPENAKIVSSEEEGKQVSEATLRVVLEEAKKWPREGRFAKMREAVEQVFAIEYDLEDFPMDKLLDFLYRKLDSRDVKVIYEKDPWLAARFSEFLQNPFHNEEFKKEFDMFVKTNGTNKTVQTDQNIKNLAMLAFANNMLNN